ncbi:MAG: hypothetical protein WAV05_07805 [Anaerolineales bacterium]
MKKSIQSVFLAFIFITVVLSGCASATTPVPPTLTPIPPTATYTPIPPTSTPAPIPGIDEPIVVKNVTVKGSVGISLTGDIQLRLLSADTKESLDSQSDSHLLPGNIFLILGLWLSGQSGSLQWIGQNATLTCGTDEYRVELWGIEVGDDGRLKAWRLIFEVPQDSDYGQCVFNLKEYAVELGTLFK